MLIAFAPNVRAYEDRPIRHEVPVDRTELPQAGSSGVESPALGGRLVGATAAVCWLGLAGRYLLSSGPVPAGRLGPELVALLALAAWAVVLAAVAHHVAARSERHLLAERSRLLVDLLERVDPTVRAPSGAQGDSGATVH